MSDRFARRGDLEGFLMWAIPAGLAVLVLLITAAELIWRWAS